MYTLWRFRGQGQSCWRQKDGGWRLGLSYRSRPGGKSSLEVFSNDTRYGKRWAMKDSITDQDKDDFRTWVDSGMDRGALAAALARSTPTLWA